MITDRRTEESTRKVLQQNHVALHYINVRLSWLVKGFTEFVMTKQRQSKIANDSILSSSSKNITIQVVVAFWNLNFTFTDIPRSMTVSELKRTIELIVGIPADIMQLRYLDAGELNNDSTLSSKEVVNYATLCLNVFPDWERLFTLVCNQNFDELLKQGVTYPSSDAPMLNAHKRTLVSKRRIACLFLSANRGMDDFLKKLLEAGFDVNAKLESGCSALHTAVACGKYSTIDLLLNCGTSYDMKNDNGELCLQLAKHYGHSQSARHLSLFEWKKRARGRGRLQLKSTDLMMHQQFDSGNPTWLKGKFGTTYLCSTKGEKEFSGTCINAPRISPSKPKADKLSPVEITGQPQTWRTSIHADRSSPSLPPSGRSSYSALKLRSSSLPLSGKSSYSPKDTLKLRSSSFSISGKTRYSTTDALKPDSSFLSGFSELSRLEDEQKKLHRRLNYKAPLPSVTSNSRGLTSTVKKVKRSTMYTDFDRSPDYQHSITCSLLSARHQGAGPASVGT